MRQYPPRRVLHNPHPHCLQLTVDFMSGSGISSLAQNIHLPFLSPCRSEFYSQNTMVHLRSSANMHTTKFDKINYLFFFLVSYQHKRCTHEISFGHVMK